MSLGTTHQNQQTRRLIINADGFGFGPGATQGILDAVREGNLITSVSVNANFPEADLIRDLLSINRSISIGVHLNPIVGMPCLPPDQVPSLVSADGHFLGGHFVRLWRKGEISVEQLEKEFDAQISRIVTLAPENVTHLDSHQNSHLFYFDVFLRLAKRWKIRCLRNNASLICLEAQNPERERFRTYALQPHLLLAHTYRKVQMHKARRLGFIMADRLITVGYASGLGKGSLDNWIRVLKHLPIGTYEIYCHPAYPDETLRCYATYVDRRALELDILRNPELREIALREGIQLINFLDLAGG